MSAPVKKCEVCDDTGSKSRDISGDLDCMACSAADERVAMRDKLGPMMWIDEVYAWRGYQLGKAAAAPVVPVAAQPVVQQEPIAYLKYWAAQSWSGCGDHEIEYGEGLEVCEAGEIGADKLPAFPVYAAPSLEAQPAGEVEREKLIDALAQSLTGSYDCMRVWSAWGVGTMSEDDFNPISDDRHRLEEIADELIAAMAQGEKQ